MPATRRKALAQPAPQTIEEAAALAGRYAEMLTRIEQLRADADASIAAIEAARDAFIAPVDEEAKAIFLQLRAWWGVAGDTLTEGKRKSIELAGCLIGIRTTPPSVATGKMKVDEAVAAILRLAAERIRSGGKIGARLLALVRTKRELDKPAILKELVTKDLGPLLTEAGFVSKRKEEFFIDRPPPKAAPVEELVDPAAEAKAA